MPAPIVVKEDQRVSLKQFKFTLYFHNSDRKEVYVPQYSIYEAIEVIREDYDGVLFEGMDIEVIG